MKTIKDLTSVHINKILSIIFAKEITAGQIHWTEEKDFVIAIFKVEECTVTDKYDTVEYGIQITDDLCVNHVWYWKCKHSTSNEYRPLYNHHAITKYLINEGFNV